MALLHLTELGVELFLESAELLLAVALLYTLANHKQHHHQHEDHSDHDRHDHVLRHN